MCCCGKPVINGEPGYRWQHTDKPSVRQPAPPPLQEGDELLADEPGRCGGLDAHSHHFRLVKRHGYPVLLVQHGGGAERIDLGCSARLIVDDLLTLESRARYWMLHTIYSIHDDARREASKREAGHWQRAAAEKRIRTRKMRRQDAVKVWIEPTKG